MENIAGPPIWAVLSLVIMGAWGDWPLAPTLLGQASQPLSGSGVALMGLAALGPGCSPSKVNLTLACDPVLCLPHHRFHLHASW